MNAAHSEYHELIIPAEYDGARFDQALAGLLSQYSRTKLKHWIDVGDATLNGCVVRPREKVTGGDRVGVQATLDASVDLEPQSVPFDLVYADEDLIVVDKPAGVVVHPGAGNRDQTLVNGLLARFSELGALPRAGLVHRIDKDTSGLLIVARTARAYQELVRAMAARRISRTYKAIVSGRMIAGGTVDAAIARDPRQRTRMGVSAGGRAAVTHYRVAARYRAHTLLEVSLETGRTHQIRVHMAWLGHPLVGDTRYGTRPRPPRGASAALLDCLARFPRQALHAAALTLAHPITGVPLEFRSPTPTDVAELIALLGADLAAGSASA